MLRSLLYVLVYTFIFFIFFFNLIQFLPKSQHDQTCTYTLRPFLANRYVRINYPLLHKQCR